MTAAHASTKLYWTIAGLLVLATILTVAQSGPWFHWDPWLNLTIGLVIASTKATLVALFFMHLKYEKKYFLPVVIFPLALVLIIIFSNFPDVAFGDHTTPAANVTTGGAAH